MDIINPADIVAFDGVDDATAALIFQSYLDDSKQLFEESQARSKNRQDVLSDYQIALNLNQEEMQRGAGLIKDRQMSKSIRQAISNDAQLIAAAQAQDEAAFEDRRVAFELGGVPLPPAVAAGTQSNPIPVNYRDLEIMEALYVRDPNNVPVQDTGILATGRGLIAREREPLRTCVVCQEEKLYSDSAPVACPDAHAYCRDCLQDLFHRSFRDESLFPPKCCGEIINPSGIRLLLNASIIISYEKRKSEMDDPNRTYCSIKNCSAYIPRESIHHDCGRCPNCATKTCIICKAAWHDGDCPADTGLQQVLANANKEKWQRCASCRTMVDLTVGCNHITCRCGHEFCYVCGAKWQTCKCPLWEEGRLLEEERRVVQPAPAAAIIPGRGPAYYVARQRQNHDQNHCDHPRFVRRPGRHVCDTCGEAHSRFGFRCLGCNMARCATCRYNR